MTKKKEQIQTTIIKADNKADISMLARKVIGSLNLANHPEWKTRTKTYNWLRKIRKEWAR